MNRCLDIVGSIGGLIAFSPVIAAVGITSHFKLGSPVFFRQERPGLNGKPFFLVKFRTMSDKRDEDGELLPDAERMTAWGNFLRRSSLDELPTLLNVLKGDMSFVGPRPLMMQYIPLYNERQARRHEVRPGITGWAQVNGRNTVAWEQRFEMDVWYVENQSLKLDLKILWMTVGKVLKRDGISEEGQATMSAFQGTPAPKKSESEPLTES